MNKNKIINYKNKKIINESFDFKDTNVSSNKMFCIGERVFHDKFGMGEILNIYDNKANVEFDKAGNKNVITSFLKKQINTIWMTVNILFL